MRSKVWAVRATALMAAGGILAAACADQKADDGKRRGRRGPQEARQRDAEAFVGVGVAVEKHDDGVYVKQVVAGGPAEQAGVLAGETITHINGVSTSDMSVEDFVKLARGQTGTVVKLRVRNEKGESRDVDVTRAPVRFTGVSSQMLPGKVALLKISTFDVGAAEDAAKMLKGYEEQGVAGVLLDLRGSTGGRYDEQLGVVELFLPQDRTLWWLKSTADGKFTEVKSNAPAQCALPLVVLIDGHGSSGELAAVALQTNERAVLVGRQTSGTTSMKEAVKTSDGATHLVVTHELYASKDTPLTGKGVTPNVEVREDADPEAAIKRGVRELRRLKKQDAAKESEKPSSDADGESAS